MKIVINTNIVFSALLNPSNIIGKILINGIKSSVFYSVSKLEYELNKHMDKLKNYAGYTESEYNKLLKLCLKNVHIIDKKDISQLSIDFAFEATKDIDIEDVLFVSLTHYLDAKLWTGDKKLINGLRNKGLDLTITTAELLQISEDLDKENYFIN